MRRTRPARRGPLIVVVLCLVLVALSGCGGSDPAPAVTPLHPGTAATSTTSTPTSNPTDDRYADAVAAVRLMYLEFNRALRSGKSASYRATFTKECGFCLQNADLIDRTAAQHRSIVGGQYSLAQMQKAIIHGSEVLVQGQVTQRAARIVDGGHTVRQFKAAPAFWALWTVKQVRDSWVVVSEEVPR